MLTVGEHGVGVGIQGAGCGDGVALDAGHLHQTTYGVARQTQVVLQAHLGGILNL